MTKNQDAGPQGSVPPGEQRRFEILLLTEDDRVIERIRHLLEPGGYAVTVHHLGRAGLDALETGAFPLCLVDQDLMDISGFEVVGQGKVLSENTEFVMLFEYPNISKALLALSYGAFGYLTKPLDDLGALLTKIILAREKISVNLQLRTLTREFEARRRQELDVLLPLHEEEVPSWNTQLAEDLG